MRKKSECLAFSLAALGLAVCLAPPPPVNAISLPIRRDNGPTYPVCNDNVVWCRYLPWWKDDVQPSPAVEQQPPSGTKAITAEKNQQATPQKPRIVPMADAYVPVRPSSGTNDIQALVSDSPLDKNALESGSDKDYVPMVEKDSAVALNRSKNSGGPTSIPVGDRAPRDLLPTNIPSGVYAGVLIALSVPLLMGQVFFRPLLLASNLLLGGFLALSCLHWTANPPSQNANLGIVISAATAMATLAVCIWRVGLMGLAFLSIVCLSATSYAYLINSFVMRCVIMAVLGALVAGLIIVPKAEKTLTIVVAAWGGAVVLAFGIDLLVDSGWNRMAYYALWNEDYSGVISSSWHRVLTIGVVCLAVAVMFVQAYLAYRKKKKEDAGASVAPDVEKASLVKKPVAAENTRNEETTLIGNEKD
ncbi:hypothetical protein HDU85_004881 [Gaertneriomyces sp. JEL0708]|nr:hypothetical protein HDU85_004881 [Gaertneriomyces sp. JEL0708]